MFSWWEFLVSFAVSQLPSVDYRKCVVCEDWPNHNDVVSFNVASVVKLDTSIRAVSRRDRCVLPPGWPGPRC